jgi:transcriptional regulator with XRE-family HTH domain
MDWARLVGSNVRQLRKQRGLTQEQLALDAAIDLRYLGGIERGTRNPSVMVLGRLAEVLKVHPAELFAEEGAAVHMPGWRLTRHPAHWNKREAAI